jgi:hypothetical protein
MSVHVDDEIAMNEGRNEGIVQYARTEQSTRLVKMTDPASFNE